MKKKILALMVIAALGFNSCKKEELASPSSKILAPKVADKKDLGNYDG